VIILWRPAEGSEAAVDWQRPENGGGAVLVWWKATAGRGAAVIWWPTEGSSASPSWSGMAATIALLDRAKGWRRSQDLLPPPSIQRYGEIFVRNKPWPPPPR
jgi:hypothetical protein